MGNSILPYFKVLHVFAFKIEHSIGAIDLEGKFEFLFEVKSVNDLDLLEVYHSLGRLIVLERLLIGVILQHSLVQYAESVLPLERKSRFLLRHYTLVPLVLLEWIFVGVVFWNADCVYVVQVVRLPRVFAHRIKWKRLVSLKLFRLTLFLDFSFEERVLVILLRQVSWLSHCLFDLGDLVPLTRIQFSIVCLVGLFWYRVLILSLLDRDHGGYIQLAHVFHDGLVYSWLIHATHVHSHLAITGYFFGVLVGYDQITDIIKFRAVGIRWLQ